MASDQQIIGLLTEHIKKQLSGVLATVISVEGSAYKREGAKLIIESTGISHGMISGGCLEPDVIQCEAYLLQSGNPCIKRYELEEDLVWGLGLGCPGTVEILLEPIGSTKLWNELARLYSCGEPNVVCKLLHDDADSRGPNLIITSHEVFGGLTNPLLQEKLVAFARRKLAQPTAKSEILVLDPLTRRNRVFFDVYFPPPQLFIFGAGHDAIPLANISHVLGLHTIVIDTREAYNSIERFPTAKRLIIGPEKYSTIRAINKHSYIVIMNHHLELDLNTLAYAMQTDAAYVGLLGPRKRKEKLLNQLKEQGIIFSKKQLEKLFSPIGLDIGAISSEEIAVSMISEILAYRNGHGGGFLRDHSLIHQKGPVKVEDQV